MFWTPILGLLSRLLDRSKASSLPNGQDSPTAVPSRMPSNRSHPSRAVSLEFDDLRPIQAYFHNEVISGVTLLIAALAALIWANSAWSESYHQLRAMPITVGIAGFSIREDLRHWINDLLMAVFFFVVGLEIKRELIRGELSELSKAALPGFAALGGMLLPALIFLGLNFGTEAARGWGIPMATDLAFALGTLALLGPRAPSQLRIFLLALAIVDDIAAILVIAIYYTRDLSWTAIGWTGLLLTLMLALRLGGVRNPVVYLLLGLLFWVAVFKSGVHATIAGVMLAALVPAHPWFSPRTFVQSAEDLLGKIEDALSQQNGEAAERSLRQLEELAKGTEAPLERLERLVHPWVSYVVLPLFALANAGVTFSLEMMQETVVSPVAIGVFGGLVLGKFLGITAFSWMAVRLGLARLPKELTWSNLIGVGTLAGIGFTVSLFMSGLAFEDPRLTAQAELGILAASLVAATAGYAVLRLVTHQPRTDSEQ